MKLSVKQSDFIDTLRRLICPNGKAPLDALDSDCGSLERIVSRFGGHMVDPTESERSILVEK